MRNMLGICLLTMEFVNNLFPPALQQQQLETLDIPVAYLSERADSASTPRFALQFCSGSRSPTTKRSIQPEKRGRDTAPALQQPDTSTTVQLIYFTV